MYIWNTEALATELKQGTLSQRERFKYLFLTMFFYSIIDISWQAGLFTPESIPIPVSDIVMSVIYNLIILIALYLCYRINRAGDDQDFIARYTCLFIPLSFRAIAILLIFFIISLVIAVVVYGENESPDHYYGWVAGGLGISVSIWIAWRLLYWFRWISHGTTP